MKTSLTTAALAALAITVALAFSSCAQLAGSSIVFDDNGNAVIVPAIKPTVIKAEGSK